METKNSKAAWPQQTFCQGGDNLQPADYVLLPLQGGYRLVTKQRGHPSSLHDPRSIPWTTARVDLVQRSSNAKEARKTGCRQEAEKYGTQAISVAGCATKFAQVGFAQALDKELRIHGIKVGVICPGGVKTEFATGRGRTEEGVSKSDMLEPEDVAEAVLLACTQSPGSRIM